MNHTSDGGSVSYSSHCADFNSVSNYCNNNGAVAKLSRYQSQKKRDWTSFGQYLKNHRPPLALAKCSGAHVVEFLKYLDQFGKTRVHEMGACPYYGHPQPPVACECPLRQAWGSLDALVGRLRAAFDENGAGSPESNPFGARAVRLYLRHVRDSQSKARGIAYEKKRRKNSKLPTHSVVESTPTSRPDIHLSQPHQNPAHVTTADNHLIYDELTRLNVQPGQVAAPEIDHLNPSRQLMSGHLNFHVSPPHDASSASMVNIISPQVQIEQSSSSFHCLASQIS